jgi:hypothetical protein
MYLVAQMIEGQQPIEEHELGVRTGKVVFSVFTNVFQLADDVISEVSDGSGSKWRQP